MPTSLSMEKVICPSSSLWHARFGHLNYNSLRLLRKNGVFGFPTIPKEKNKCDACILGKHSELPFHESNFRASVRRNICRNNYVAVQFPIIYLSKTKSEAFQTFKDFHALIEKQAQSKLVHLILTMGKNTLQMFLKIIFTNMELHIRLQFPTILKKTV